MAQRAHSHEFDPWTPEGAISPDQVFTRATDRRGHKTQLQVSFPPDIVRQVGELVASRRIPTCKTPQDFVRDAVVHRAHYWAEQLRDAELERVVDAEVRESRAAKTAAELDQWDRIIQAHRDNYEKARLAGSETFMMRVVLEVEEILENEALDPAFTRRLREIVDQHYGRRGRRKS